MISSPLRVTFVLTSLLFEILLTRQIDSALLALEQIAIGRHILVLLLSQLEEHFGEDFLRVKVHICIGTACDGLSNEWKDG